MISPNQWLILWLGINRNPDLPAAENSLEDNIISQIEDSIINIYDELIRTVIKPDNVIGSFNAYVKETRKALYDANTVAESYPLRGVKGVGKRLCEMLRCSSIHSLI